MDACASVTIDDCTNCTIVIGPTEGSVFIRDCSGCTFAVISRQLRSVGPGLAWPGLA
jgi:protein XRP2